MAYVTAQEYQEWLSRMSNGNVSLPSADIELIEIFLADAEAWLEDRTDRWFEGRLQTRYYDEKCVDWNDGGRLLLDADLLTVAELTNGNGLIVPVNSYRLGPLNTSPKWSIRLSAGAGWVFPQEGLIAVTGMWGNMMTPNATIKRMVKRIAYHIQATRTAGSTVQQLPDGGRLFEAALPPDVYDWVRNNKRLRGSYESS